MFILCFSLVLKCVKDMSASVFMQKDAQGYNSNVINIVSATNLLVNDTVKLDFLFILLWLSDSVSS